jgi:hypothetical protein
VSIVDNDQGGAIQFSAATYTTTEPVAASITVTRTGTSLASGASVQFATSNGTATAGIDYTATVTTLVFAAGETTKTVPIPILPAAHRATRPSTSRCRTRGGAAGRAHGCGAHDRGRGEGGAVQRPDLHGDGGNAGDDHRGARRPDDGSVTVPYATADGSATAGTDYTTKNGTLTFGQGSRACPSPSRR